MCMLNNTVYNICIVCHGLNVYVYVINITIVCMWYVGIVKQYMCCNAIMWGIAGGYSAV
jgi:hypothetical protein